MDNMSDNNILLILCISLCAFNMLNFDLKQFEGSILIRKTLKFWLKVYYILDYEQKNIMFNVKFFKKSKSNDIIIIFKK